MASICCAERQEFRESIIDKPDAMTTNYGIVLPLQLLLQEIMYESINGGAVLANITTRLAGAAYCDQTEKAFKM